MRRRTLVRSVVRCEQCGDVVIAEGQGEGGQCGCGNISVLNAGGGMGICSYEGGYTDLSEWDEPEEPEEPEEPDPFDPVTGLFSLN